MARFVSSKAMGKVTIKTDANGKTRLVRVKTYPSVSARLAAKKKRKWKPAK